MGLKDRVRTAFRERAGTEVTAPFLADLLGASQADVVWAAVDLQRDGEIQPTARRVLGWVMASPDGTTPRERWVMGRVMEAIEGDPGRVWTMGDFRLEAKEIEVANALARLVKKRALERISGERWVLNAVEHDDEGEDDVSGDPLLEEW